MKAVADGDFEAARKLMFDEAYDRNKQVIVEPLNEFQSTMNARAAREAADAASATRLYMFVMATMLAIRSEEHTSELQSLMRNSYAVLCLNKKPITNYHHLYLNTNCTATIST